jgi:hypothetical protein
MKKSFLLYFILLSGVIGLTGTGCQKGNLVANPNQASSSSTVPVSLILNRIDNELYNGGGVMDNVAGSQSEVPFTQVQRWNQFFLSLYSYYWGLNTYNWSETATMYSVLKYVELLEQQTTAQFGTSPNPYPALAKFFRAYLFVWYSQRVGDIPMSQAGNTSILTPAYDTQHDVYQNCLALLDTANTLMNAIVPSQGGNPIAGDIYGLTIAQWQKVINTYKLRVLISMSNTVANGTSNDIGVPAQFANIINNPTQYPILGSNSDNLAFHYNAVYNKYPTFPSDAPYDFYSAMNSTFLNITTANQDPRTFIAATPAPAQLSGGGTVGEFSSYVGANINLSQADLLINATNGMYSYPNNLRYFQDASGATEEPYVMIGYPEMCFNIAEAANLGWISGSLASTWYTNGINGSLALYNLTNGETLTIGDNKGNKLGTVTVNIPQFLTNANVVYAGNNTQGWTQILQEKFVSFWQNSGWEAYYNWRRTGVPAFAQGGAGIGTPTNNIPLRWQYPNDEVTYNAANWQKAITNQYGGTDDLTQQMWLIK